ncbi:5-amino-6-(5-phospho-D-ribitylamino)uracil phosphatase YigB [Candidatus Blochmannia ocreatus (nom. nud.)]|uniref:5-amino-6-(5-phospho-D-ribitylamino)uracil phosphatase YigB n=1 Tax=Candidatus Blochmannia ocreatus (nom. nud.) TaxID=251538 RepID=A0ABY4SXQ7_9ENTR|nr:5-amino-6-(5-phospho-D-ribitylamino)uracil phosphatase YigB [Candidatus Blochmannia ocreatus]URJ25053.1 5-amino-6-(5-phospho-D-ribitylamino)uracil phosphatase YigB [Candidatus Blochmannia ocreatus]
MHFYRILQPFRAITLDLDNTLYNNHPIINQAESESISFLQKYHPALLTLQQKDYNRTRTLLKIVSPNIPHNANYLRWESLRITLLNAGLTKNLAESAADSATDIVIYWRNKINISFKTHNILSALSSKWPLIAITNGNANPNSCGLHKYFYDILRAGVDGRAKPHTDMYQLASKRLGLPCKNILHVGDDLNTDIKGAIFAGMQSCWINRYNHYINDYVTINKKFLPNFKISTLVSLTKFL